MFEVYFIQLNCLAVWISKEVYIYILRSSYSYDSIQRAESEAGVTEMIILLIYCRNERKIRAFGKDLLRQTEYQQSNSTNFKWHTKTVENEYRQVVNRIITAKL